ncbi:MAG: aldo/keto reductase [Verrucomicrobia bacterium]|nr:aldo/keto reductase [Verrucomicrobiota bacterium]
MLYRRFGQTELSMPVLTCGGMRYQQSWQDIAPQDLDRKIQENVAATVQKAFNAGINHIETARGYGSSEYHLGFVLPELPRHEIIVQTKIGPKTSESEFRKTFEISLQNLRLSHVDLLSIHGINTQELLTQTLTKGSLKACRRLQDEGLVRHVGFSTHGPRDTILAAINCGEFSYLNLHWYYFDQWNWPAILAAQARDMGVFIISPSDKGGKLYAPPEKLKQLCAPLAPITLNDLFCLSHPEVHTLSIGAARPSDFDAHLATLPHVENPWPVMDPILQHLHAEGARALGEDWWIHWTDGLPPIVNAPQALPLYHILRLYNLTKAFDMLTYGQMRYNILGGADHWFPGFKAGEFDEQQLRDALQGYRFADQIPERLRAAHALLNADDKMRLSQS